MELSPLALTLAEVFLIQVLCATAMIELVVRPESRVDPHYLAIVAYVDVKNRRPREQPISSQPSKVRVPTRQSSPRK